MVRINHKTEVKINGIENGLSTDKTYAPIKQMIIIKRKKTGQQQLISYNQRKMCKYWLWNHFISIANRKYSILNALNTSVAIVNPKMFCLKQKMWNIFSYFHHGTKTKWKCIGRNTKMRTATKLNKENVLCFFLSTVIVAFKRETAFLWKFVFCYHMDINPI